jgi:hypothetical protein
VLAADEAFRPEQARCGIPSAARPVVGVERLEFPRTVEDSGDSVVFPRSDLGADPGGARRVDFEALAGDASKKPRSRARVEAKTQGA